MHASAFSHAPEAMKLPLSTAPPQPLNSPPPQDQEHAADVANRNTNKFLNSFAAQPPTSKHSTWDTVEIPLGHGAREFLERCRLHLSTVARISPLVSHRTDAVEVGGGHTRLVTGWPAPSVKHLKYKQLLKTQMQLTKQKLE